MKTKTILALALELALIGATSAPAVRIMSEGGKERSGRKEARGEACKPSHDQE